MVDALNVQQHLNAKKTEFKDDVQIINECIEQIAFADKIIINKIDLISPSELTVRIMKNVFLI
jgi:G3E family GTPase